MNKRTDVIVLRTAHVYEADMAADALKQAGVPHYRRQQSSSGLEFGMPVAAAPAPGLFWLIFVPLVAVEDAKKVLAELPITQGTNPGVWDIDSTGKIKGIWRVVAQLMLLGIFLSVLWQLAQTIAAWLGYDIL